MDKPNTICSPKMSEEEKNWMVMFPIIDSLNHGSPGAKTTLDIT